MQTAPEGLFSLGGVANYYQLVHVLDSSVVSNNNRQAVLPALAVVNPKKLKTNTPSEEGIETRISDISVLTPIVLPFSLTVTPG